MAFDAGAVERARVEDGVEEEDAAVERTTALVAGTRMWEVYAWVVEARVW